MSNPQDTHNVLLGVAVFVIGAAIVAFAGIPGRVSVLESKFDGIDKKLDQILVHYK